jgi:hypothetical protein
MLLETQNKSQALLRLKRKEKAARGIILGRYTKRLITEIKMRSREYFYRVINP